MCEACARYEIDGHAACEACGCAEEAKSRDVGSGLLALVGVGYLAALSLGVLIFQARPLVGGIASIVAIALGRIVQFFVKPSSVKRRASR